MTISCRKRKLQLPDSGYEIATVYDCRYAVLVVLALSRLAAQRQDIASGAGD